MKFQQHLKFIIVFLVLAILPIFSPLFYGDEWEASETSTIKIMSYNLHFGQDSNGQYNIRGLVDLIEVERPDVIGFQELTYYSSFNGYAAMFNELSVAMNQLGFKYSYYPTQSDYYSLANAVFSQYPILDSGTIDLKPIVAWQRMAVWVLLDINGIAPTRLYVTHLTHKGQEDYRVDQATQLMIEILKNDLSLENTILVGDFNMREFELIDDVKEPVEEYDIITADLKDAWLSTTNQLPDSDGFTSSAADPDKRIDYIFLSSQIIVEGCTVINTLVSDHLPLFCTITLP